MKNFDYSQLDPDIRETVKYIHSQGMIRGEQAWNNPINILAHNYQIYIHDGYHRLAAHVLANKELIRTEILNY